MFHTIADFEKLFASERETTLRVMNALTDASLSQPVGGDHRTLGRMAWHICTTYPEMMKHTGLKLDVLSENTAIPAAAKDIKHAYEIVSNMLLLQIKDGWKDETLSIEDEMYGQKWARRFTLQALIQHEVHHRGQMTVLMRQAGVRVPSIYGPAQEDWSAYGMEPPKV